MRTFDGNRFWYIYALGLGVGALALALVTCVSVWVVKLIGIEWPGAIFGNDELSWRDCMILAISAAAFLAGVWGTVAVGKRLSR